MDKTALHPPVCERFNKSCHRPPSTLASYFSKPQHGPPFRKRPADQRSRRPTAPFATPQAL
jgi:hypothetical protein